MRRLTKATPFTCHPNRAQVRACAAPAADAAPEAYHPATRLLHAISGAGMLSCVGLVLWAQSLPAWGKCTPEEKKKKGDLMFYHKSIGLTMLGVMVPRVAMRLMHKAPAHLPGNSAIENTLGQVTHVALYGLIVVLPVSGFVMSYMGGNGLPFFFTTLKPASGEIGKATNGALADKAYNVHSKAGKALQYLVPVHVGAAGLHMARGQAILSRINPFAKV